MGIRRRSVSFKYLRMGVFLSAIHKKPYHHHYHHRKPQRFFCVIDSGVECDGENIIIGWHVRIIWWWSMIGKLVKYNNLSPDHWQLFWNWTWLTDRPSNIYFNEMGGIWTFSNKIFKMSILWLWVDVCTIRDDIYYSWQSRILSCN